LSLLSFEVFEVLWLGHFQVVGGGISFFSSGPRLGLVFWLFFLACLVVWCTFIGMLACQLGFVSCNKFVGVLGFGIRLFARCIGDERNDSTAYFPCFMLYLFGVDANADQRNPQRLLLFFHCRIVKVHNNRQAIACEEARDQRIVVFV